MSRLSYEVLWTEESAAALGAGLSGSRPWVPSPVQQNHTSINTPRKACKGRGRS